MVRAFADSLIFIRRHERHAADRFLLHEVAHRASGHLVIVTVVTDLRARPCRSTGTAPRGKDTTMPKPEMEFQPPSSPWTPAPGPASGIWQQVLAADPATGAYTGLSRWDPGADSRANGPAVHPYWEEVYILTGELTDLGLGQTFTAGMYACRPPGMVHGPWQSAAGALLLEVCYPPPPADAGARGR